MNTLESLLDDDGSRPARTRNPAAGRLPPQPIVSIRTPEVETEGTTPPLALFGRLPVAMISVTNGEWGCLTGKKDRCGHERLGRRRFWWVLLSWRRLGRPTVAESPTLTKRRFRAPGGAPAVK